MKRTKFNNIYEDLDSQERLRLSKIESGIQTELIAIKITAYEIGKMLHEAKKILPHGSFKYWIKTTFADDLPYSTAYFYMRIYETFKKQPGSVQYIPTEALLMLTQKQFPEEALALIKGKIAENPEKYPTRKFGEIKEVYDMMKNGTIGGSAFLTHVRDVIDIGKEMNKRHAGRSKHRINGLMRRPLYFGLGDILKKLEYGITEAHEMAGYFPYDPHNREHQKIIQHIEKIIEKLNRLKYELQGGGGFFNLVSTENGDEYRQ